jgi:hypothetical protein
MDGEIGIKICGGGKVEEEVKRQINEANRVAGCYMEEQTHIGGYEEQNLQERSYTNDDIIITAETRLETTVS